MASRSLFHRLRRLVPVLWLLAGGSGCAHFSNVGALPPDLRTRLGESKAWLTTALLEHESGVFPPTEVLVIKKWEVAGARAHPAKLREVASSSLVGLFQRLHAGDAPFTQVDLKRDLEVEPFLPTPEQGREASRSFAHDLYEFRDLGNRRFELRVNGGRLRIVFSPAPDDYTPPRGLDGMRDVGIWRTPFGAETELLSQLTRAIKEMPADTQPALPAPADPDGSVYLHHDLSVGRQIPVVVDPSFPTSYLPALKYAAAQWNAALKTDLFRVEPEPRAIDPADCVTGLRLCVRWLGPPELAYTGANGYTNMAFDPQTGLITGGVISLINDDVRPPLKPMAPPDRARVLNGTMDWDWVASTVLRYTEMNDVQHPLPVPYTEYLLLHEFGHFNGFGHNFYVSNATTLQRPITSVMTYPPFPLGHLATYLGDSDLARIALVYGRGTRPAPPPYCSTFDAMMPRQGVDGLYHKPAHCDLFTVGDQADWYIRLAQHGGAGPFTGYPDLSHLSDELRAVYRDAAARKHLPPFNVLTRLGFILVGTDPADAGERARVTSYLCSLAAWRGVISAQLQDYHNLTFKCPEASQ